MQPTVDSTPHILLTGATGFIGGHLLRALLAKGYRISACVRDPQQARLPAGVTPVVVDFCSDHSPEQWLPRLVGVDAVVNAVGILHEQGRQRFADLHRDTPIALFKASALAGVRRVIQISALGADAEASSGYHLSKRAADDALAALPLDWTILRPAIVFGRGAGSERLFRALAALPITPLVGSGGQRLRPLAVEDLVQVVLDALALGRGIGQRIDLVGADEVTLRDYLAARRAWLGWGPLRPLHLPIHWARRLAAMGGRLGIAGFDADAITMLARGSTAPLEPTVRAIGFHPRGFRAWLAAHPAVEGERWYARLYFLPPLLRWSVALTWLAAGVTSALLWPAAESYQLLAEVGIAGAIVAPLVLYGAAALDIVLGIATFSRRYLGWVVVAQMLVTLGYSALITYALPHWWLHPFGPVVKNLPLLAATAVLWAVARPRS